MGGTNRTCIRCGKPIGSETPRPLCPPCLLSLAMGEDDGGDLTTPAQAPVPGIPSNPAAGGALASLEDQVIGNYKILQKIGEGGFGVVYMAEQLRPVKRRVALKIIKIGMDTEEVVARFEAERQALAMMEHPSIAKVFDAGATDAGRPYFVMELVRGIPITQYCDEHRLSTHERLRLFCEVCDAVQHAHQKGIIHRDLKPSNVMVAIDGTKTVPKVIDFGIAKATHQPLTDRTLVTRYEQFAGTPVYMSPEQARMSGLDIDTRSDIYSLGVMLYELLTGQTPFRQEGLIGGGVDAFRKKISDEVPAKPSTRLSTLDADALDQLAKQHRSDPRQMRSLLRGDLDWIVMKAIEKDRTRRYESAGGLEQDIQRHLNNQPVLAAAPSLAYTVTKFAQRNRKGLAVGLLVALSLLTATVVSSWQAFAANRAKRSEELARGEVEKKNAELEVAKSLAEENLLRRHHEEGKAWVMGADLMLLQNRFLSARIMAGRAIGFEGFGRSTADDKFRELFPILLERDSDPWARAERIVGGEFDYPMIWSLQGDPDTGVMGHTDVVKKVVFSPDGSKMATAGWDRTVRLWDCAKGEQIGSPLAVHDRPVWSVAFSPDGRFVASGDEGGTLVISALESSQEPRSVQASDDAIFTLAFHPNSRALAASGFIGHITLWDVGNLTPIAAPIEGHRGMIYDLAFDPSGTRIASASIDGSVRLWDFSEGREIGCREVDEVLKAVAFHPGGHLLATGGSAGKVQFWTVPNLDKTITLDDQSDLITGLSFSPDGDLIAASSERDHVIRIWQAEIAEVRVTLEGHGDEVMSAAFAPDGAIVASCGKDYTVRLWHVERAITTLIREPVPAPFGGLKYAWGGKRIVAANGGDGVGIYDSATGRRLDEFRHHTDVGCFSISPDNRWLAVGCVEDPNIYLWDLNSRTPLAPLQHAGSPVTSLAFSPDSRSLACGRSDGTLSRWDPATREPKLIGKHPSDVLCLAFNLQGELLAAGTDDGTTHVWEIANAQAKKQTVLEFDGGQPIDALTFDADGRRLAVAGTYHGHLVMLWSTANWVHEGSLMHRHKIRSLQFSQKFGMLAVGDEGREIHLWDPSRRLELSVLAGHGGPVSGLSIDPMTHQLASCSTDGTVRLWSIDPLTWNSNEHLFTAMRTPRSNRSSIPDKASEPFHEWKDLPMGATATKGAVHYLSMAGGNHPPDQSALFWRFCQAENWAAAQLLLERLPRGGEDDRARRWILAGKLAAEAETYCLGDRAEMAALRLGQAEAIAPDCPLVLAAKATLSSQAGDAAQAGSTLRGALALADQHATTPAGQRERFEIAWRLYQFHKNAGHQEEADAALKDIADHPAGWPAGMQLEPGG